MNAQHKIDTTFTLDSIWRNDTLFLVKTTHLSVIIDDTSSVKTPKIDTLTPGIDSISDIKKPIKKHNLLKTNIYPYFEFGFFKIKESPPNLLLDSSITYWHTNTFGVAFEVEQKYFLYSTGFQFTNFYEKFHLADNWKTIDSTINTHIEDNSYWNVDTVWYLDLDSLLIGDTVWLPLYDSSLINQFDTSFTTDYDTSSNSYNYNRLNKVKYVEFPLIFGFHFGQKKWKYSIKTGLITGVSVYKNYIIAINRDEKIIEAKFVDFSFWFYSKIGIQYSFSEKFSGRFGVYGRIPLNNQLSIFDTQRKYYSWGFSFGFSWRIAFNY